MQMQLSMSFGQIDILQQDGFGDGGGAEAGEGQWQVQVPEITTGNYDEDEGVMSKLTSISKKV